MHRLHCTHLAPSFSPAPCNSVQSTFTPSRSEQSSPYAQCRRLPVHAACGFALRRTLATTPQQIRVPPSAPNPSPLPPHHVSCHYGSRPLRHTRQTCQGGRFACVPVKHRAAQATMPYCFSRSEPLWRANCLRRAFTLPLRTSGRHKPPAVYFIQSTGPQVRQSSEKGRKATYGHGNQEKTQGRAQASAAG